MNGAAVRLLVIDDDSDDFILVRDLLEHASRIGFSVTWKDTYAAGLEAISSGQFDAALVDYRIGPDNGIELIRTAVARGVRAPMILMTSYATLDLDLKAQEAGAMDFINKFDLKPEILERVLRYAITRRAVENDLRAANAALEAERARFAALIENLPIGVVLVDASGEIRVTNPALFELFPDGLTGDARGPSGGYTLRAPDGRLLASADLPLPRSLERGEVVRNEELLIRFEDGREMVAISSSRPIYGPDGAITGAVAALRDVTELIQSRRAQAASEEQARARAAELEALMDSLPAFVWVTHDAEARMMTGNRRTYEMVRSPLGSNVSKSAPEEQMPRDFRAMKDGREIPTAELPMQRASRGELVPEFGFEMVFEDGQVISLYGSAVPLTAPDGSPSGAVGAFIDITERVRSEERYRLLTELSPDTIFVQAGGCFAYINPAGVCMFGAQRPEDLLGKRVLDCIFPEDRALVAERIQALNERRELAPLALERFQRLDGEPVLVEAVAAPIEYDGQPGALVVARDVTERERAQDALRLSEERFRLALEGSGTTVFSLDRDLRYTWIYNPRPPARAEDVIGRPMATFTNPEQAARTGAQLRQILETGQGITREVSVEIQGQPRTYVYHMEPMRDEKGEVAGITGAVTDVTALRALEQEQASNRAFIEMQRLLITQREQERTRVARDLHDGPLQDLIALSFEVYTAGKDAPQGTREALERINERLHQQINDLRAFAGNLRPPTLSKFGLERAIRAHLDEMRIRHPQTRFLFDAHQDATLLPEEIRLALYRIYQEAIYNSVRHAQAGEVRILMRKDPSQVTLEIADDGQGFDLPEDLIELARRNHLGIVGMRERANSVGGTLEVQTRPDAGTVVQVRVPLGR